MQLFIENSIFEKPLILTMSLALGDIAPNFNLKNSKTEDVNLSDYAGQNLIILFFPLAFTGVCTEELCHMRDNMNVYTTLGTQVVAISVDSPFTLGKFKAENNLDFPLLSDFNKEVSQAYGAYYEDFVLGLKGVSKRAVFVINKEGKVHYSEVLENAGNLPNFEALKNALSTIN